MEHPLENPSLTPFGFVLPNWRYRLDTLPDGAVNGDREISLLWAKINRLRSIYRPAEYIVHHVLPSLKTVRPIMTGDFSFAGRPYYTRDILVLSSFIRWLGTNCGLAIWFYDQRPVLWSEMSKRLNDGRVNKIEYVLTHWSECPKRKKLVKPYRLPTVSERDEALVRSLLFWLQSHSGRNFRAELSARFERMSEQQRLRRCRLLKIAS